MPNLATISNNILADSGIDPINLIVGTGTVNYIPKFTGEDTLANSAIQDDGSSISIGRETFITGTTAYFQVGNGGAGTGKFQIEASSGSAIIGTRDASSIAFRTNLTTKMTLDTSGILGLGVTPSAWQDAKAIQVGSTAAPYLALFQQTTSTSDGYLGWNARLTGYRTFAYITTGDAASLYRLNAGNHVWFNAPSGTAGNAISFTQAMTLLANGNLLVGQTNDDGYKFALNGVSRSKGEALLGNYANLTDFGQVGIYATDSSWADGFGSLVLSSRHDAARPILFTTYNGTSVAERARITPSGVLRLTSYGSGSITGTPTYRLAVDASGNVIEVTDGGGTVTGTGTAGQVAFFNGTTTIGSEANFLWNTSTNKLTVDNGSVDFRGLQQDAAQIIMTLGALNAAGLAKNLYVTLTAGGTPEWKITTGAAGTDAGIRIIPDGSSGLTVPFGIGASSFSHSLTIGDNLTVNDNAAIGGSIGTEQLFVYNSMAKLPSSSGWGIVVQDTNTDGLAGRGGAIAFGAYRTDSGRFNAAAVAGAKSNSTGGNENGDLVLYSSVASSLTERVRVLSAGRTLMGTSMPTDDGTNSLQVYGGIRTITGRYTLQNSLGNPSLEILEDGTSTNGGAVYLYDMSSGSVKAVLSAAPTRYNYIDNSGNFGIGYSSAQGYKFEVNGTGLFSSNLQLGTSTTTSISFRITRTNSAIPADANYFIAAANTPNHTWIEGGYMTGELSGVVTAPNSGYPYFENYAGQGSATVKAFGFVNKTSGAFVSTDLLYTFTLARTGSVRFNQYGSGSFTGTAAYNLAVDSSGNIIETAGGVVDGSGTANYVPKWSDPNTLTNSLIYDNGTNVAIGTTSPINTGLTVQTSGAAFSTTATKNSNMYGLTLVSTTNENTMSGVWFGSGGGSHWSGIAGSRSNYTVDWSTHLSFYTHVANTVNITDATEKMRITGDGNVGIGTTSPQVKLSVQGAQNNTIIPANAVSKFVGGDAGIFIGNLAGTPNYGAWLQAMRESDGLAFPLHLQPNGGSVGIGTTSPTSLLHVNSATTATQTIANFAAANYGSASSRTYIQIGTQYGDGSSRIGSVNTTGNQSALIFQTQSATSGIWNDAMYITGGGEVGIGTTSPSYKLDVTGSARFNGSGSNGYLYVAGNSGAGGSTNPAYLQGMNFSWNKSNGGGESLITYTGAGGGSNIRLGIGYWNNSTYSEQFTILSNGNAGIGTTSPSAKLHIGESGAAAQLWLQRTDGYNPIKLIGGTLADGNGFKITMNTTDVFAITSGNNVGIGNTNPYTKLHVNNAISGAILPYINGTGLSYNNEGISVAGSNTNNTNIGNGLTLYNNVASVGAYGPVVAWSSMTPNGAYNSTYAFITGVYAGAGGDSNWAVGDIIFGTASSYGATERMRLTKDGSLGIGTSSVGYKLTVYESTTNPIAYFGTAPLNASSRNALIILQSGTIPQNGSDTTGEAGFLFKHSYGTGGVNGTANGGYIESIRESVFGITSQVNTALVFGTALANVDGEAMRITSNKRVGIGTSNPQSVLQVNGNFRLYTTNGDGNELRGIFNVGGAGDPLSFSMYKADAATIGIFLTADGSTYFNGTNVLVNTTSDNGTVFRVAGAAQGIDFETNNISTFSTTIPYTIRETGVSRTITSGGYSYGPSNPLTMILTQNSNTPLGMFYAADNAEGAGLKGYKSRGTVAAPVSVNNGDTIFSVEGWAFHGSGPNHAKLGAGMRFVKDDGFGTANTYAPQRIEFYNANSTTSLQTNMAIFPNGNTTIGTSTYYGSYKLYVQGIVASSTGFLIDSGQYTSISGVPYIGIFATEAASSDGFGALLISSRTDTARPIIFGTSNGSVSVERLRIAAGGAVTATSSITATSFFESSDARLKSDIVDLDIDVSGIIAKSYFKNGIKEIGYIAQDVENIIPSAVSTRENGYLDLSYRQIHTAKIAALEKEVAELKQQLKNK